MTIDLTKPTPLYLQIVGHIKSQIEDGTLRPGDSVGSHHGLAQEHKVSLITIRKALSVLVNEGILYSRVGKGTYVSGSGQKLDLKPHVTIGLILRDLDSPFFARIVENVEKYSTQQGCNLMVSTSMNSREQEAKQINKYLESGISGLIVTSVTHDPHVSDMVRKLHAENFPYVVVAYIDDEEINYIGIDHELGAFLATEHLIRLGYKKIGYIDSEPGYPLGEIRKNGFVRAINEYGLTYYENFHFRLRQRGHWHDYESGYEIARILVDTKDKPDAVFVYNDLAALGFEKGLLDNGLGVPDDVAIVGFDNIKRGVVAPVPLTTIHQPVEEVGRLAIEMLLKCIQGQPFQNRVILKPQLVIRHSCGAQKNNLDLEQIAWKTSKIGYEGV